MVYSIKGNSGFFRVILPRRKISSTSLEKLFPETILPEDYMAFLSIHNGFSKATDTGITPTYEMEGRFQLFQSTLEGEEVIFTTKGSPVNPKSLIPFYESFGMPFYQCFWSDWYPENEMGNVYYSGLSLNKFPTSSASTRTPTKWRSAPLRTGFSSTLSKFPNFDFVHFFGPRPKNVQSRVNSLQKLCLDTILAQNCSAKALRMYLVKDLWTHHKDHLGLELIAGEEGLGRQIKLPEAHRPGLSLSGFLKSHAGKRILIFGRVEIEYLKDLEPKLRIERLENILSFPTPAVIVARGYPPLKELTKICQKIKSPFSLRK